MAPKKDSNNSTSSGSGKLTKEEERLLLESSRQVTRTTSALFYGNAFIVSALPLCKPIVKEGGREREIIKYACPLLGCIGEFR